MMKKLICLLFAGVLAVLSACGCDDGRNTDLVFVNNSDTTITAVLADFEDQSAMTLNADSSPLKRSECFCFEAGIYPVRVAVYGDLELNNMLGYITIQEAPPEGERWYVTAKDSAFGLLFTVDTCWPEGV